MSQQETLKRAADASAGPEQILEERVPLSRSFIWRMQRDFYGNRGLKAWTEDLVPSYITNNPYIAEIYAGIIAAFVQECLSQGSPKDLCKNPLRILELGAGTGKFAWLLLRKLTELLRIMSIPLDTIRYVMTECSENLVREWKQNEYLAEFVRQDLLEFGVFAAEEESCSADNGWLAERHKSSLIVIANYVFDSLPQDAFTIEDGQLYEFVLTSSCAGNTRDFQDLQFSFDKARVGSTHYLHPEWNSILEQYRARLSKATVLFPATALKALQSLRERSNGAFLVLAADKGITHEDDLTFLRGEPPLEFHASKRCFSQIVNFDALAKDFQNRGGEAFLPQKSFSSLNLCAFLDHPPEACFSATRNASRQATEAFGPDDLFALMSWLNDHLEQIPLAQAIALLRLTRWDPTALARLFPAIASQARNAGSQRNDLRDAVLKTWANHYPLSKDENILAFSCGVILLELRFFSEAHEMFRKSQQLFEPSAATSYNLGLCCLGMDRPGEALELMREACSLDPTFQPAQQSRLRLESQLSV